MSSKNELECLGSKAAGSEVLSVLVPVPFLSAGRSLLGMAGSCP